MLSKKKHRIRYGIGNMLAVASLITSGTSVCVFSLNLQGAALGVTKKQWRRCQNKRFPVKGEVKFRTEIFPVS